MVEFIQKIDKLKKKYLPRFITILLWIFLFASVLKDFEPFQSIVQTTWITSAILVALLLISSLLNVIYEKTIYKSFVIYPYQGDRYFKDTQDFLSENEVKNAKFIEFSTRTIQYELIRGLAIKGCKIQLLLQHPKHSINKYQRERIGSALPSLLSFRCDHPDPNEFEIKLYTPTASLRGRKFDNKLISVGWYTYGTKGVETSDLMPEHIKKKRRHKKLMDTRIL